MKGPLKILTFIIRTALLIGVLLINNVLGEAALCIILMFVCYIEGVLETANDYNLL